MANVRSWKYLPIKLHYFFIYGGYACSVYFLNGDVYHQVELTPKSYKIFLPMAVLCIWLSKVVVGFIADKCENMRKIFIILLIVTTFASIILFYVPPREVKSVESTNITAVCKAQNSKLEIYLPKYEYNSFCEEALTKTEYWCLLTSHYCLKYLTLDGLLNVTSSLSNEITGKTALLFKSLGKDISNEECDCLQQNLSTFSCEHNFYECNSFSTIIPDYQMYNVWMFTFLYIISRAGVETLLCLTDALCIKFLRENSNQYGKQRLWGSIGWTFACLALGVSGSFSGYEIKIRSSKLLCAMVGFFVQDLCLLCIFPIEISQTRSMNVYNHIEKVFFSLKTIVFIAGILISGISYGLMDIFGSDILWNLDARFPLFHLLIPIRDFVAGVPFFFFSGWFIKKIGHVFSLIAMLFVFTLSMGLYSLLRNPWWVLPIEFLQGLTFAIFSAAMILYAVDHAPPGTEATILGIFEGFFYAICLSAVISVFLSATYEVNSRGLLFKACMISLGCTLILTIFSIFIFISEKKLKSKRERIALVPMTEIARNDF